MRPNFITEKIESFPINVKVFSRYGEEDYDTLDNLAEEQGYLAINDESDEKVEHNLLVGMQNSKLHCGWIATFDDYNVKAMHQIALLNTKIGICKSKGEDIIIGFCQTGKFSIGYTIYVKQN